MNTKTMRLPPRRVLTPTSTTTPINSTKRKDRDEARLDRPNPNSRPKPKPGPSITSINPNKLLKPNKPRNVLDSPRGRVKGLEPTPSNQLLAGFLAHEFLTKGTLCGEPWDPSRAVECATISEADERKGEPSRSQTRGAEPDKPERYGELAELLRTSGTHVAGIVNPTQLSRFLHL